MRTSTTISAIVLSAFVSLPGRIAAADPWNEGQFHEAHPGETYYGNAYGAGAIYSYPVNTQPDGWAALKAEPSLSARRVTKIYDGTLFRVIGELPGWKLVRFKSGETGWIAARLVGCCRPASH